MDQKTIEEGKTMAIIAYVTLIGTLIAFIMNNDKQNEFVKFHIGQALRAWLTGIVLSIFAGFFAFFTGIGILRYLSYAGVILAILGLMNAMNGKMEKIPIVGSLFEK